MIPELVETTPPRVENRPDPDWVRGVCPICGEEVISNAYYVDRLGYIVVWECWASRQESPTCDFRRVL